MSRSIPGGMRLLVKPGKTRSEVRAFVIQRFLPLRDSTRPFGALWTHRAARPPHWRSHGLGRPPQSPRRWPLTLPFRLFHPGGQTLQRTEYLHVTKKNGELKRV